ncbi:MAG: AI-2E family transporter [Acidobacteriota bacterium]
MARHRRHTFRRGFRIRPVKREPRSSERRFLRFFLIVPSLLVLYFVFRIFQPFILPTCLAAILASLCYPVYGWLFTHLKGRSNWAALATCLGVTAIIIIPFIYLVVALASEATLAYRSFQRLVEEGEIERLLSFRDDPYVGSWLKMLEQYVDFSQVDLVGGLAAALQQISLFFIRHSSAIFSSLFHLFSSFFIMVITMFFLFRDGARLVEQLRAWTPLSGNYETLIITKFQEVSTATVVGSLLTAVVQGAAGGIVFWALSIPNALLWGTLMALFSLVPVIGTAIVWVPWVLYLLATGAVVRAIILAAAAILFVGMIDNVLRPLLIEGKAKMHTLLVFFSIVGGIAYFGIIGMILGPIIVALGLTFLELYRLEYEEELAKPAAE